MSITFFCLIKNPKNRAEKLDNQAAMEDYENEI
jgi:hypothetical protein